MYKIIFKIILGITFLFFPFFVFSESCDYNPKDSPSVAGNIGECLSGTTVYQPGDLSVEGNFKDTLLQWVTNISIALAILAVGAIVMGGATMILSAGEEEKINKGKERVKWGILGFLAVVSAGSVIAIIVNVMYYDNSDTSGANGVTGTRYHGNTRGGTTNSDNDGPNRNTGVFVLQTDFRCTTCREQYDTSDITSIVKTNVQLEYLYLPASANLSRADIQQLSSCIASKTNKNEYFGYVEDIIRLDGAEDTVQNFYDFQSNLYNACGFSHLGSLLSTASNSMNILLMNNDTGSNYEFSGNVSKKYIEEQIQKILGK